MTETIQLFIACHKACEVPSDPIYLPLHVGAQGKEPFGFTGDNTGDNISEKNPSFCELTGLYWCWKNLKADYYGLVHYRRYFSLKSRSFQKKYGMLPSVLTEKEVRNLLKDHKILLPKKRKYYIETIYSHYDHTFDGHQLDVAKEVISEKYSAYRDSFDWYMKQRSGYVFNMFVMPKDLCDSYCTWLFDILFEVEKRIDDSQMTDFEKRYIGRVSERLFNVWLHYQIENGNIQPSEIKEVPYIYLGEMDWGKKITSFLAAKVFHKKYEKSF